MVVKMFIDWHVLVMIELGVDVDVKLGTASAVVYKLSGCLT